MLRLEAKHRFVAQKGVRLALQCHMAEAPGHAVAGDHGSGNVGDLGQVVRRTGGQVGKHQPLRSPAAEQYCHLVFQLFAGHQEAIFDGSLDGIAQRAHATGNDRHLVHRVDARQCHGDQRVAHFVIGDNLALTWVEQPIALLQTGDDALDGGGEVFHTHRLGVTPGRQ